MRGMIFWGKCRYLRPILGLRLFGVPLAVASVLAAGCSGSIEVGGGGGGGGAGGGGGGGGGGTPTPDEIRIRLVNDSDVDVDTQFYAANTALENPAEELFAPAYRVQAGIGVAGTGIVQADTDDEIVLPCGADTIIGTAGGQFLDPDTGTPLGQGQTRLLTVGSNFDCGNTLIFGYTGNGGDYDSVPPIPDSR